MSAQGLGRVKTQDWVLAWADRRAEGASRSDGGDQRLDADDVQHSREIVRENVQRHFGGDLRQGLHQEVCRAHSGLHGSEWMLDRLTPLPHGVGIGVETLLDGFQHPLVCPPRYASLSPGRAL